MKRILDKAAFLAVSFALVLGIVSCGNGSGKVLLPNVSGRAGEVIIVVNKYDWEGAVGNELRSLLTADCPYLPQSEPLYTLVNIAPIDFTNIFQIHRNLLLVNINKDVRQAKVEFRKDVWAKPQCVISVDAPDSEAAVSIIKENETVILNMLEQAERDRVIANSKLYEERSLRPTVIEFAGGTPYFPSGYALKKKTDDFLWIAYDTQILQDIFIYKYPAAGKDDFTIESMVAKRNEFLQKYVPGMLENSYMVTREVCPTPEYLKYKDREFAQIRGLWDVHNDYMGGPFVSHSFYSRDGKEIIVVEGFVYAPKFDKRNYMRQVEAIVYSFEWDNNERKE